MKKVIEKCKKAEVYMYLIPSMVIFSIFLFYPFFKTIYLSLYKTNKLGEAKLYVGLDNYKSLLSNPSFYNSLWVTLEFVAIVVVGSMALGLLGAVLCSKTFPGIPGIQYFLCTPNGSSIELRCHDFQDYLKSHDRYRKQIAACEH